MGKSPIGDTMTLTEDEIRALNIPEAERELVRQFQTLSADLQSLIGSLKLLEWLPNILGFVDFTTAEPAAPSDGDAYINTVTGVSSITLTSVTQNNFYQWDGDTSSWKETVVSNGMATINDADSAAYVFTTSWQNFGAVVSHLALLNVQGGSSSEQYHLTQDEHDVATNQSVPNIYYVSQANGDNTDGTGAFNNPYKTIPGVLADHAGEGEIEIHCDINSYNEAFTVISGDTVIIVGEGDGWVDLGATVTMQNSTRLELRDIWALSLSVIGPNGGSTELIFKECYWDESGLSLNGAVSVILYYFGGDISNPGTVGGTSSIALSSHYYANSAHNFKDDVNVLGHNIKVDDPTADNEVDTRGARNVAITTHTSNASAHHAKTETFQELNDTPSFTGNSEKILIVRQDEDAVAASPVTITTAGSIIPPSGQTVDGVDVSEHNHDGTTGGGKKIPPTSIDNYYQQASSEAESQTTDTTYTGNEKLKLTTPSLPAGTYRIVWSMELTNSNKDKCTMARVHLDDTTVLGEQCRPKTQNNNEYVGWSGFKVETLTAAVHTIDIDFRAVDDTAYIRRARLEIWKVS